MEPGPALALTVNKEAFEALPNDLQHIVKSACGDETFRLWSEMTVGNARALGVLVNKHKVKLRRFPTEVYKAMLAAGDDVARETADKDPFTGKVYESWLEYKKMSMELAPITELGFMSLRGS